MNAWRAEKPAEIAAIPHGRHVLIEASAGTGKTYLLEHLVVDLILERGARIEDLLVVTFTERATFELLSRVRSKLQSLLEPPERRCDLPPERSWLIDVRARTRLREALGAFDRAAISTLHAFCQRVLVENAFAGRRLLEQRAVEERSAFAAALREVLRRAPGEDPEVRALLSAWLQERGAPALEDLLFSCHAGRGLLRPVFDPQRLGAAVDSFRAIAGEATLLPDALRDRVHGRTLEALARRLGEVGALVAQVAERGLPWFLLAAEGPVDSLREGLTKSAGTVPGHAARVLRAAQDLCAAFVPLGAAVAQRLLPRVQDRLAARKEEAGLFDFHDMLALVDRALQGPGGPDLARLLRDRYRYVLIDEFQDTDDLQWSIFERVFFEADPPRPLYLIGDPKQAIYGFRGADVGTYLHARSRVLGRDGVRIPLMRSFRATPRLIEAQNLLFDQAAAFFSGDIRYDEPVSCGRPDQGAFDAEGREVTPVHVFRVPPAGTAAKVGVGRVRRALGRRIAAEIRALLAGGLRVGRRGEERPVRGREIFVLTRTASEGYEIGRTLRETGVPHAFYKQDGLFQTIEASDVRDLLAAIDDPHDRSKRFRAWITPFFAVPLDALAGLEEVPGTHPIVARLFDWKALADAGEHERLFERVLEESGVTRRLLLEGDERALTNYHHLFEVLLAEANRGPCTLAEIGRRLSAFVEERDLPEGESVNVQRLESERDAVQIMTLHKAKGLEAAVVFLYGGLGAPPWQWTYLYHEGEARAVHVGNPSDPAVAHLVGREAREEDERLLYVALTRARARLYLPLIPALPDGKPACALQGCYRVLNPHVERAVRTGVELFSTEDVPLVEPGATPAVPGSAVALVSWRPSELIARSRDEPLDLEALRGAHAGFAVTSYSRMKEALGGYRPAVEAERMAAGEDAAPAAGPDDLPTGAATGVFLHELLERLDLCTLSDGPPFDAWRERPAVAALVRTCMRAHGIDARHRTRAERLVFAALTHPLDLGGVRLEGGMARAQRVVREMEFLYPYPEVAHPRLGEASAGALAIERGYIKGFVDILFEHGGRVYFADWKSDQLPAWDAAAIERQVRERYELQARLYALAHVKMLGIRDAKTYGDRFGGMVYAFLRGIEAVGSGIYFARPGWEVVRGWEEALAKSEGSVWEVGR